MKGRPDLIKPEIENVLSVMSDNPRSFSPEEHPVMYTFQLIWQRILKASRSPQTLDNDDRQYLLVFRNLRKVQNNVK